MRCVLCGLEADEGFVAAGEVVRCADSAACQAREEGIEEQLGLAGMPEIQVPDDADLQARLEALPWRRSPGYVGSTGAVSAHEYNMFDRMSGDTHREMSRRLRGPGSWSDVYNGFAYRYLQIGDWVYWKLPRVLNRRPAGAEQEAGS